MDHNQLKKGLRELFYTDGHRLVFWYDAPGHFADELDELSLGGVQILNMAGQSTFGVKLRLELDEPETPMRQRQRCSTFPTQNRRIRGHSHLDYINYF